MDRTSRAGSTSAKALAHTFEVGGRFAQSRDPVNIAPAAPPSLAGPLLLSPHNRAIRSPGPTSPPLPSHSTRKSADNLVTMTSPFFTPPLYSFMLQQVAFFKAMHETRSLLVWPELGAHIVSANGHPHESITIITPTTSPRSFADVLRPEGYEDFDNRYGSGLVFHNRERKRTIF